MSTLNGGPGNIVTDGLIAYYDIANYLSYTSGSNTLYGVNSNLLSGSIVSASYSPINTGYLEFNGTSSAVTCNSDFITTPVSLTIELWTRPGPNVPETGMNPLGYSQPIDASPYIGFIVHNGTNSMYSFITSGSTRSNSVSITSLNSGSWYQVVFSYNISTQVSKGYRNGVVVGNTTCPTTYNVSSSFNLVIGRDARYPNGSIARHYTGSIASVRIYNRALSDTEVLQNYNAQKSRFGL